MTRVIYFNGLGNGKPRRAEKTAFNIALWYLARHGVDVRHVPVDWYKEEPFQKLLERMVSVVRDELAEYGSITLCGVSAGGSLAVNVLGKLRDDNLSVIVLCGPVRLVKKEDGLTLKRLALRDTARPSQSLINSVTYCSTTTIPALTLNAKRHIITVRQLADGVVPRRTTEIPGVKITVVPGVGHMFGILVGILYIPNYIKKLSAISS